VWPRGSRRFWLPDFHDIRHVKVVRLLASRTSRLYPQECSWYSFSLGAESTPGPWYGRKKIVTEKCSDTTGNRSRDRPILCSSLVKCLPFSLGQNPGHEGDEGVWSALLPGRFYLCGKSHRCPLNGGLYICPRASLDASNVGKKISLLDIEPQLLGHSSLSQVITLRHPGYRSVSEHWQVTVINHRRVVLGVIKYLIFLSAIIINGF
jgi:hypothetical protein